MEVTGQLYVPAAVPPGSVLIVPIEYTAGGLRAGVDILKMNIISCPCQELNNDSLILSLY